MRKFFLIAAGLAGLSSLFVSGSAHAPPDPKANTTATIAFSPGTTVPAGTLVTITGQAFCAEIKGSFCTSVGKVVTVGKIQIQRAEDGGGGHTTCANALSFETLDATNGDPVSPSPGQGTPTSGSFSVDYDTTGLGGQVLGFQTHYIGQSNPLKNSDSVCVDLTIGEDPLPDGTTTRTQGFYGASPIGEDIVDQLIDEATCNEIVGILNFSGFSDTDIAGGSIDCSSGTDRDLVAFFLTGTVGPGNDLGFLPAGNPSVNGPGLNLAAQKITLLLNLNLDAVLTGDDIPIEAGYFLNIDPVQDIVDGVPDGFFDPILTTGGELGSCVDTTPADDVCDASTVVLTPLGVVVTALDDVGTTVEDILIKADDLIESGDDDIEVNGVTVTRGDMTAILGLINESYDEGTPTGFVTAFDAD